MGKATSLAEVQRAQIMILHKIGLSYRKLGEKIKEFWLLLRRERPGRSKSQASCDNHMAR